MCFIFSEGLDTDKGGGAGDLAETPADRYAVFNIYKYEVCFWSLYI